MGFMKHLRPKSRVKEEREQTYRKSPNVARYGRDFTAKLPDDIVKRILVQVCPHTEDYSYLPSERSSVGDGCMLCDLRDLAQSARVCRRWYSLAQSLL